MVRAAQQGEECHLGGVRAVRLERTVDGDLNEVLVEVLLLDNDSIDIEQTDLPPRTYPGSPLQDQRLEHCVRRYPQKVRSLRSGVERRSSWRGICHLT